jgi:acyl transferase domain-containing protein/NADPH:quinone reductase-like Zn-dependent oxidoreductase
MILPYIMSAMSKLHFLSPDGRSHSFDSRANGYSRGEGVSFVVLKPLDLALRDGDMIRAVIRNTGSNQDGNTPGITVPSAQSQKDLIELCYRNAGLNPADTQYVEAHGTGTQAGDPLEASALAQTFGASRPPGQPVYLGSIKSNIGHLEGASGLASLTKSVMALEKGLIPPNIWFDKANPRIPMKEWNLQVPTELQPWPTQGQRRVSVNSFGYGGSNVHIIIDDAYHYLKERGLKGRHQTVGDWSSPASEDSGLDSDTALGRSPQLDSIEWSDTDSQAEQVFVWSSSEKAGLQRLATTYQRYLKSSKQNLADGAEARFLRQLSYTLFSRRTAHPWRSFAVASSVKQLLETLEYSGQMEFARSSDVAPVIVFVFTGQGAQWFAMGRELMSNAIYRATINEAEDYLKSIGCEWSLLEELERDHQTSLLKLPHISQFACTALQIALVNLLRDWGVAPQAVVGHSSGEISAAYAAGYITSETAYCIAYHRGRLSSQLKDQSQTPGAMLATSIDPTEVKSYLVRVTKGKATVACINSPGSITLSGDLNAIMELEKLLSADGYFARRLQVDAAYHSHHMQAIADEYRECLNDIVPFARTVPVEMYSSLTGELVNTAGLGADYWVANLTGIVNFNGAVQALTKSLNRAMPLFVEIGPHAALQGPLKQINKKLNIKFKYTSALLRGSDAILTTLNMAGNLFLSGVAVDLNRVNAVDENKVKFLADIDPYPWNHSNKYWNESQLVKNQRLRKHPRLDLLGAQTPDLLTQQARFRNILRLHEIPWMEAHQVQGSVLYPAAGMIIMAIEGMKQLADESREIDGYELRDVTIGKAIVVDRSEDGTETMLCIQPRRLGTRADTAAFEEFVIYSLNGETWNQHCSGLVRIRYKSDPNDLFPDESKITNEAYRKQYQKVLSQCVNSRNMRTYYENLESIGLKYGPLFQNLTEIHKGEFQAVCALTIPDTKSAMPGKFEYPHVIHPATLDCIVQMGIPAATPLAVDLSAARVPTFAKGLFISADVPSAPGSVLRGYSVASTGESSVDVVVSIEGWEKPLVILEGFKSTTLRSFESDKSSLRELVSTLEWNQDYTMLDPTDVKQICSKPVAMLPKNDPFQAGELERLSFIFMKRVLGKFTDEEIRAFPPHISKFYAYMHRVYDRVQKGEFQKALRLPSNVDWIKADTASDDELIARVGSESADGILVCQHGKHLPGIMRGDEDTLQVLLEGDAWTKWYIDGLGCAEINKKLGEYIKLLAHKKPDLKILEIGAGTGGTTLRVLESLGGEEHEDVPHRFRRYDFTDISAGFFEKAAAKFSRFAGRMTFAKLDISEDPLAQGFKEGEYDVVIAANVLHATQNLGTTLQNVRKLMKPNGKLVLNEITIPRLRAFMSVGSLPGWWLGEADGREWAPTIGVEDWDQRLRNAGFTGVDVSMADLEDPEDQMGSVMVSTAKGEASPMPSNIVLVVHEDPAIEKFAAMLSERLSQSAESVTSLSLLEVTEQDLSNRAVIFLLDYDSEHQNLASTDPIRWTLIQKTVLNAEYSMWISRGATIDATNPFASLMSGLSRSMRSENPALRFLLVDLDANEDMASISNAAGIERILTAASKSTTDARPENEFAIRGGQICVPRLQLHKGMNDLVRTFNGVSQPQLGPLHQDGRPLNMGVAIPGRLDTLRFATDSAYKVVLSHDDVEIEVKSIGLNFKDLMISMGQLDEPELGFECSGVVRRVGPTVTDTKPGDRVMTFRVGCFRNFVNTPSIMAIPIPDHVDFQTAASVPLVFGTAYYALYEKARLDIGQTVLIHSAAGGVGQAAIMLAQRVGAEIFATVSSATKKKLLIEKYNIEEDHIFNSRDTSFSKGIMRMTKGRGVDVVLNSLNADFMRESWYCTARFGQFVELGQKDIVGNTGLEMAPMLNNITHHSVNLIAILEHDTATMSRILNTVMQMFGKNMIQAVSPVVGLPIDRVEEAFRTMQTGQHMGKLVLNMEPDSIVSVIPAMSKPAKFKKDATYVLTGGFGGVGRSIAQWMISHGARNLAFLSRSGASKPEAKKALERFIKQGVKVAVYPCDIANLAEVQSAIKSAANEMPPIKGLIQGAMVLEVCSSTLFWCMKLT